MLSKSLLESTGRDLVHKVALVLESFFLLSQLLRHRLLLKPLLSLKIEWLGLVDLFVCLFSFCNLRLAIFPVLRDLVKHSLMSLKLLFNDHFSDLGINLLLFFCLMHITI